MRETSQEPQAERKTGREGERQKKRKAERKTDREMEGRERQTLTDGQAERDTG